MGPLNLPEGSIRSLLALVIVVGAGCIFAFTDKMTFVDLVALVTPVTALYFGQYVTPPGGQAVQVVNAPDAPVPVAEAPKPARRAAKR
jgi:hypothetical protein